MMNADSRLLLGAGVILLALSLVNGFLIEAMPLMRLARSAHLVGLLGSAFLIGLGAGWPALGLARRSRIAAVAAVYGFFGGWLVYFLAAATGTGGMFPIASGNTRGSVSGLAAGCLLARRGVNVTVFEANERPGGCCATARVKGCTFDDGALYLAVPPPLRESLHLDEQPKCRAHLAERDYRAGPH